MKTLLMTLFIVVAFVSNGFAADVPPPEPKIVRFYPDFITNTNDKSNMHYVQLRIEVMVMGDAAAEQFTHNQPLLQDKLMLLLNSKSRDDLRSIKGKRVLKIEALTLIQDTLKQEVGKKLVEKIQLSNLVVE